MIYLKKAVRTAETDQGDVHDLVVKMLDEIAAGGEDVARKYARDLDKWAGDIIVLPEQRAAAAAMVPAKIKADIQFAHANIKRFAEAQAATVMDCEVEILPGLIAGQKQIPVSAAGCYVPGGRYSHIASAIMTITTAKVAGVAHISACSPPPHRCGHPARDHLCDGPVRCRCHLANGRRPRGCGHGERSLWVAKV